MGLGRIRGTNQLSRIRFYCDECQYLGGTTTAYHPASFWVGAYNLRRREQRMITKEIQQYYIGEGKNLTQIRMDDFFRNDANFVDPKPGFFARYS
jgi:hypothetical protein